MKIQIINVTGSQNETAELNEQSGIIFFNSGEIGHILFEKQLGKSVQVYQESVAMVVEESLKRSEARPEIKSKRKSSKA
jgi:hypothetical protein